MQKLVYWDYPCIACRLKFVSYFAFSRVSDKQSLTITKLYGKKVNLSCWYDAINFLQRHRFFSCSSEVFSYLNGIP